MQHIYVYIWILCGAYWKPSEQYNEISYQMSEINQMNFLKHSKYTFKVGRKLNQKENYSTVSVHDWTSIGIFQSHLKGS